MQANDTTTDDVVVILGDLGQERRDLGRQVRDERDPLPISERDPDTPALRRESPKGWTAGFRLRALKHRATKHGFARQALAVRYQDGGVDYRYLEVRDTTPDFARSPRYAMWVTEFGGHHVKLTEDEALQLLAEAPE